MTEPWLNERDVLYQKAIARARHTLGLLRLLEHQIQHAAADALFVTGYQANPRMTRDERSAMRASIVEQLTRDSA